MEEILMKKGKVEIKSIGVPEGYNSEANRKFREENWKRNIERREAMKSPELKMLEQQLQEAKEAGDKRRVETLKYRIERLRIIETYKDCSEDMINLHLEGLRTGKNLNEERELFALMMEQERYERNNPPKRRLARVRYNSEEIPTSPYKRERAKVSRFDRASNRRAASRYIPNA